MKKVLYLLFTFTILGTNVQAQTESPYKTKAIVDAPIILVGAGTAAFGLSKVQEKKAPTPEETALLRKEDVNEFDRFAAGYYDLDAKKLSDYPFYGSFGLPFLLLFDKDISEKAGQTGVLYLETMAITGALFTMTIGYNDRYRPLVYNNDPDNKEKFKKHAKNSFYAGHTAATAAATFFAAKVYHDYNPYGTGKFFIWGAAAAIPATVGYLRLKAGKHFLSDNIIGYVIGSGVGILVPQLHKVTNNSGVSIAPIMYGPEKGVLLTYSFK